MFYNFLLFIVAKTCPPQKKNLNLQKYLNANKNGTTHNTTFQVDVQNHKISFVIFDSNSSFAGKCSKEGY